MNEKNTTAQPVNSVKPRTSEETTETTHEPIPENETADQKHAREEKVRTEKEAKEEMERIEARKAADPSLTR